VEAATDPLPTLVADIDDGAGLDPGGGLLDHFLEDPGVRRATLNLESHGLGVGRVHTPYQWGRFLFHVSEMWAFTPSRRLACPWRAIREVGSSVVGGDKKR